MKAEKNIFAEIKNSGNFPKLPQVMVKLLKACNDEQSDTRDVTEIISTDPGLVSKMLQVIGSVYANLPGEVKTIKDAVVYLGLDTIKNMAISSSAMHFFKLINVPPGFDMNRFWLHSYKCGLLAQQLAREYNLPNEDEFFLAGLLHDIGRLVLIQTDPEAYETIISTTSDETRIQAMEMEIFGADTPRISAWFFRQWNLNPIVSGAVLFINEPVEKIQGELAQIKAVYLANILADPSGRDRIPELAEFSDLSQDILNEMTYKVEQEADEMAETLGIKGGPETAQAQDDAIGGEIKDYSLLYGTLDNLLKARDLDGIMEIAQNGLKIMFNVGRVFFFFPDERQGQITGDCSPKDRLYKIIKSIALPMSNKTSLLVESVKTNKIQSSFMVRDRKIQAMSDTQIIRLLETEGMICIPVSSPQKVVCLIVAGVSQTEAGRMYRDQGMLDLFSRQVGVCMENLFFHQEYAANISQKKMEAYAILTDRVVHEINNPIAIIKNYLESLRMRLPDKHPAQEELSVVGEEMNRVAALLEDLSVFAKPRIGGLEPLDVNRFCSRIFEFLNKSFFMSRRIDTDMDLDPELPKIKTDRNALKQVLINLLKNSAEAMKTGGKIQIKTRFLAGPEKIMIDEKKKDSGRIEICITDNGPGISPQILSRLFEPYNSSKKGKKNQGLGLAIVHSIVKELNGDITCETEEGAGTSFSVFLPVTPDEKPERL